MRDDVVRCDFWICLHGSNVSATRTGGAYSIGVRMERSHSVFGDILWDPDLSRISLWPSLNAMRTVCVLNEPSAVLSFSEVGYGVLPGFGHLVLHGDVIEYSVARRVGVLEQLG